MSVYAGVRVKVQWLKLVVLVGVPGFITSLTVLGPWESFMHLYVCFVGPTGPRTDQQGRRLVTFDLGATEVYPVSRTATCAVMCWPDLFAMSLGLSDHFIPRAEINSLLRKTTNIRNATRC